MSRKGFSAKRKDSLERGSRKGSENKTKRIALMLLGVFAVLIIVWIALGDVVHGEDCCSSCMIIDNGMCMGPDVCGRCPKPLYDYAIYVLGAIETGLAVFMFTKLSKKQKRIVADASLLIFFLLAIYYFIFVMRHSS